MTVLAGPTGTGKSSLFNSLIRFELSPVGLIRPTTLTGLACVWDPDHAPGATALLDRLGVEERRRTLRGSLLDGAQRQAEPELAPLVLVDLPDHDSGMRGHRDETDRAAVTADLLVFVTDPQKYADAELHDRYLRKLVHHQDSVAVVLNKIERCHRRTREPVSTIAPDCSGSEGSATFRSSSPPPAPAPGWSSSRPDHRTDLAQAGRPAAFEF